MPARFAQAPELGLGGPVALVDVPTSGTPLAGVVGRNRHDFTAVELPLVLQQPTELSEGGVQHDPVEAPLTGASASRHVLHLQVLDHDPTVALGKHCRSLVECVTSHVADPSMGTGELRPGLASVRGSLLLPRHLLLELLDLPLP